MRVISLCLMVLGCGEASSLCKPGASASCACVGGGTGVQICAADGTFQGCECRISNDPMLDMASSSSGGKRVFVTSTAYSPTALERACADSALAAGLGGSWTSWLSTSSADAIDRIVGNGPWRLLDGKMAFRNRGQLGTQPLVPISLTENGTPVSAGALVWTGTTNGGRQSGASCRDWSNNGSGAYGQIGIPTDTDSWTDVEATPCSALWNLYCFEE